MQYGPYRFVLIMSLTEAFVARHNVVRKRLPSNAKAIKHELEKLTEVPGVHP